MRRPTALVLLLVLFWGCSHTVRVAVPPRMDLKGYGTVGVVEFSSNGSAAINARLTREFQAQIHAAQPGTRLLELGSRETVMAAVGGRQLDADTARRIGEKHGVDAIFLGELVYSDPKTEVQLNDLSRLDGAVRTEVRGDITARLVETRSGAGVWSGSAWARRQIGRVSVSGDGGVSGTVRNSDPREDMIPALMVNLTHDFRPTAARQQVK